MKRRVLLLVVTFVLGALIGGMVTMLLRGNDGTPTRTEPEIIRALRARLASECPDHPVQTLTSDEKAISYALGAPVQAENGDWFAECRKDTVLLSGPVLSSWQCYRVEADSLGVTSIVTPEVPLYGDPRLFSGAPQGTPCDTIPEWPTP